MADNFFAQFDEPNASDQGASESDVVDNSPKVSPEQMTPRLKAAQEAVWRNAHQLQVLPFNSPEYQAALAQGSQLGAEYEAAKSEALAGPAAPGQPTPGQPDAGQPAAPANPFAAFDNPNVSTHDWKDELGIGGRAMLGGAGDLVGLGLAPLQWLETGHPFGPSIGDAMADRFGLPTAETDNERLASAGIRGATGALLTAGAGSSMASLPGVTGRVGAVLADAPLATGLSGASAGSAGEYARQHGAGAGGQLAAALAAGLLAPGALAAGGKVVGAFAPMAEREISPVMQAFDRQRVPALPADVGGTTTRMATGAIKSTLGGASIYDAAQASINAARAARDRIASSIGNVTDTTGMGMSAKRGAQSFLDTTKSKGGSLYEAIPIGETRPAVLSSSKTKLAELTAGLESNPELSKVLEDPQMRRIADGIMGKTVQEPTGLLDAAGNPIMRTVQKGGALSWEDLKTFRTRIGEKTDGIVLQSDTPQANLKALYGALTRDMEATAKDEGPKAYTAFTRANNYWSARQKRIEDVIAPILGKDGANTPSEAAAAINSWVNNKGDFIRTAQALRSLPEEEANTVRATIFSKLGDASAGRQDLAGNVFSPSDMLTHWNKISDRVKTVLFPGEQYRKDIEDILTVANAQKNAVRFANTSHTETARHIGNTIAGGVGVTTAFLTHSNAVGAGAWIATTAAELFGGKLLSNPNVARWIASSVKKPNAAAQLAHINRLTALATKNPTIANDVLTLQEKLAGHFTGSSNPFAGPQPLAAQPDQEGQQ
jgi:hypothetical protein